MANYESYLNYLKHVDNVSKETHRKEIEDAVRQKEHEMQLLCDDYESKLAAKDVDISNIKKETNKAKQEMDKTYQHNIEELKAEYEKENEAKDKEISKLKFEFSKLKAEFKKKEQNLERSYQERSGELVAKLKEQASLANNNLASQLKEKESEITDLTTEISNKSHNCSSVS